MRIAVLFDGAGLARLGLEQAGHECVGFELDERKHYLGQFVGSGRTVCADATTVDLSGFDAVWASPPCQVYSAARTQGAPISKFAGDFLQWSLALPHSVLWVENVLPQGTQGRFGKVYNAAQFTEVPLQNRNRIVGGRFVEPKVFHAYKKAFAGVCPCVTATEYKGCASDKRRASRFYGRRLTLEECAYHQGLTIPQSWYNKPSWFVGTAGQWKNNLYEAIGNGVPVYMAKAFGLAV
jgi:site-specific DNA-cytosine methylase